MPKTSLSVMIVATLAAFVPPGPGHAQGSGPNLAGTYRCSPEPAQCQAPTFSISQNGPALEIKAKRSDCRRQNDQRRHDQRRPALELDRSCDA